MESFYIKVFWNCSDVEQSFNIQLIIIPIFRYGYQELYLSDL